MMEGRKRDGAEGLETRSDLIRPAAMGETGLDSGAHRRPRLPVATVADDLVQFLALRLAVFPSISSSLSSHALTTSRVPCPLTASTLQSTAYNRGWDQWLGESGSNDVVGGVGDVAGRCGALWADHFAGLITHDSRLRKTP